MLTLFPKFKKRMIIFEVVYVALMVTLYVLKPTASPIALALMLAIPALAFADGNDVQIVVQGAAEVTAAPDMVKVTANAGVSGKTIAEAQADTNKIIDAVTRKLLELGVADDDIVTTSYAYYTTYDYSGESPVMNGYQANHTMGITCRDVDMLDSVVGVLVDCGMSEIYGIEYDVSTRSELYQQALKLAIETAAKKADVMAKAAGQTIDHLESITEKYMINMNDSAARAQAEDSGTGIRSGSISVKASVTAVYETK